MNYNFQQKSFFDNANSFAVITLAIMTIQSIRLLIAILFLVLLGSCERERLYTSNTIERTSKFFIDGKHEIAFNIISAYLQKNKEIVYGRVEYPGNSFGHLFSAKTSNSKDAKKQILFKVVDNQKSEYAIERGVELTVYRGENEITINKIFLDYTSTGMKIMNEDFHIILNN